MSEAPQRCIAHLDLDAFFVSVECLNDPSLKGKPLLVGGSRERGVVAACSYEARAYGIQSAMPMKKAMQLCPEAIVLNGGRGEYSKYSRWVTEIIAARAPIFEKASIDEFYIDLTGMQKFFPPLQWTIDLRGEIMEKTRLPISFGVGANKMIAKMATNEAKPNGYLQVSIGMEKEFLCPLPVNKIPGVGEHTYRLLRDRGIETIGELSRQNPVLLEEWFGKYGIDLWNKSMGRHESEVTPYYETKSVSTENTFDANTNDLAFLQAELARMTEKIAYELRLENKMAGCVSVKIRYPDFETTSRQTTIPYTFYDDELIPVARDLFSRLYRPGQKVRLLGVKLSELTGQAVQTHLFSNREKKSHLYRAIDEVKVRFGKNSITRGGALGNS